MAKEYSKILNREFKRTGSKVRIVPGPKITVKDFNLLNKKINGQIEMNAVVRRRSYNNKT